MEFTFDKLWFIYFLMGVTFGTLWFNVFFFQWDLPVENGDLMPIYVI